MYSEKVTDHSSNLSNQGIIEDADGMGEVGNPVCGDMITITIRVKDNRIQDAKFKTLGCGAAIAVSSLVTEMAKGRTLEEALGLDNKKIATALGGLPENKLHCSNLGADALHKAIMNYYDRKEGRTKKVRGGKVAHEDLTGHHCYCPYCELKLPGEAPFCTNCGKPTLPQAPDAVKKDK